MKHFYFIMIITLSSCSNLVTKRALEEIHQKTDSTQVSEGSTAVSSSVQQADGIEQYRSFENRSKEAPLWILNYFKVLIMDTSEFEKYDPYSLKLNGYKQVNDSVCAVYLYKGTGTCGYDQVAMFKHQKLIQTFEIGRECDGDGAVPHYYFKDYYTKDSISFTIIEQNERPANDSVLTATGAFKEGFDMDNIDIVTDTTISYMKILPSGKVWLSNKPH